MALSNVESKRAQAILQFVLIALWVFLANLLFFNSHGVVSALVMGLTTGFLSVLLFAMPVFRRRSADVKDRDETEAAS